jgi:hypothetical protein
VAELHPATSTTFGCAFDAITVGGKVQPPLRDPQNKLAAAARPASPESPEGITLARGSLPQPATLADFNAKE